VEKDEKGKKKEKKKEGGDRLLVHGPMAPVHRHELSSRRERPTNKQFN